MSTNIPHGDSGRLSLENAPPPPDSEYQSSEAGDEPQERLDATGPESNARAGTPSTELGFDHNTPKTPAVARVRGGSHKIQATPHNKGTSSIARHMQSTNVDEIHDYYAVDISHSKVLPMDDMFKILLYSIVDTSKDTTRSDEPKDACATSHPATVNNSTQASVSVSVSVPVSASDYSSASSSGSASGSTSNSASASATSSDPKHSRISREQLERIYSHLYRSVLARCRATPDADVTVGPDDKKASTIMTAIRKQMETYVMGKKENDLYGPLVDIANNVMDLCRDMPIAGIHGPQVGEEELLFQVNDPKCLVSQYIGLDGVSLPEPTYRKPDLLATSLAAARTTVPAKKGKGSSWTWNELRDKYATKKPAHQQSWFESRLAGEMKFEGMDKELPPAFDEKPSPTPLAEGTLPVPKSENVEAGYSASQAAASTNGGNSSAAPGASVSSHRGSAAHSSHRGASRTTASTSHGSQHTRSKAGKRKHNGDEGVTVSSATKKKRASHQHDGDGDTASYVANSTQAGDQLYTQDGSCLDSPESIDAQKTRQLPGAVQLAIYAGCRLSSSPLITHSLNILVSGRRMWLWYFDRGTIVRTKGMDIFKDFPFFVLLLSIFQRMGRHAFGQHSAFDPVKPTPLPKPNPLPVKEWIEQYSTTAEYEFVVKDAQEKLLRLRFKPGSKPMHLSLLGRGTVVSDVEIVGDSMSCGRDLRDVELVAKIYHPEESRPNEVDLLKHAYDAAQKDCPEDLFPPGLEPSNGKSFVHGHMPMLLGYGEHEEPYSSALEMFGVKTAGRRLFRILLFVKLRELTELSGEEYIKAFVDCFLCHAVLWFQNLHHRDVSVSNLMYYRIKATDEVHGVLNDYDLSIFAKDGRIYSNERTGTWPFMAIALLEDMSGTEHIYDFDVESFLWVVLWTTHRYHMGYTIERRELVGWRSTLGTSAADAKRSFLQKGKPTPTASHARSYDLILGFAKLCLRQLTAIALRSEVKPQRRFPGEAEPPKVLSPKELLHAVVAGLEATLQDEVLGYFFPRSDRFDDDDVPAEAKVPKVVCNDHILGPYSEFWPLIAAPDAFGCLERAA